MLSALFNTLLYNPLLNLLVGVYNIVPFNDFGISVVLVTLLIKMVLYPLTASSLASQKALQELQPKVQALRTKFKDKPQELAQQTMKLYRENKVSPFSSCLPLLIQLPILLALYWALRDGVSVVDPSRLYSFVAHPGEIHHISLSILDLTKPSYVLAVLAGAAQYVQARMLSTKKPPVTTEASKDENMMAMMNKQMLYFMPIITVLIGATLPAALTLYWFVSTLFTWLQQVILFKKMDKIQAAAEQ